MKDGLSHWRPHYCVLVKLNVGGCVHMCVVHMHVCESVSRSLWVAVWWKWRSMSDPHFCQRLSMPTSVELQPHSIYNRRAGLGFSATESQSPESESVGATQLIKSSCWQSLQQVILLESLYFRCWNWNECSCGFVSDTESYTAQAGAQVTR